MSRVTDTWCCETPPWALADCGEGRSPPAHVHSSSMRLDVRAPQSTKAGNVQVPSAPIAPHTGPHALPTLASSAHGPRGVSPNVSKRTGWTTPRAATATTLTSTDGRLFQLRQSLSDDVGADGTNVLSEAIETEGGQKPVVPLVLQGALEVLESLMSENKTQSTSIRRCEAALEKTCRLRAVEAQELERTRLAADEQLHTTLELLHTELERERGRRRAAADRKPETLTAELTVLAPPTAAGPRKQHSVQLSPRLRHSPLQSRGAKRLLTQLCGEEGRGEKRRQSVLPSVGFNVESLPSSGVGTLLDVPDERLQWKRDYELMREQVVEEKARQVALFRRLETIRRTHAKQLEEVEAALQASQGDVERLQARLAQSRVGVAHDVKRSESLVEKAREERQRLVCALAETRHKFREWKEGEASTLRAAREQAVHALRTEYELKLARHQEEKQKLRDKVKDLEVSLRLLQRDRQLSVHDLSEEKGRVMMLHDLSAGGNVSGCSGAELIEAQGRIQELEALLALGKERQERQDALLRVSEAALARLNQEREMAALESLTLPSPAMFMSEAGTRNGGDNGVMLAATATASVCSLPIDDAQSKESESCDRGDQVPVLQVAPVISVHNHLLHLSTGCGGGDPEKELLRRQSIALSAEVHRCQQIVAQSMDEVRTLKEFRRRSRNSFVGNSGASGPAAISGFQESYLLNELSKAQQKVMELEKKLKDRRKRGETRGMGERTKNDDPEVNTEIGDCSSNSSGSSDEDCQAKRSSSTSVAVTVKEEAIQPSHARLSQVTENDQSAKSGDEEGTNDGEDADGNAVTVIQTCSKGFLARREFIRKKLAIGKIKARYRGYLVRKNQEALVVARDTIEHQNATSSAPPPSLASPCFLVTEAMQFKMQIVEPHHSTTCRCYGDRKNGFEMLSIVLRVSKDPPIVQLQVAPSLTSSSPSAALRVAYFHLFETIALLPYADEELVLESSNERDIARIFASRLDVDRRSVEGDYRFFIRRYNSEQEQEDDGEVRDVSLMQQSARTLLTELPVQLMGADFTDYTTDYTTSKCIGNVVGAAEENAHLQDYDHADDLDSLIRRARSDPLDNNAAGEAIEGEKMAQEAMAVDVPTTEKLRDIVRRLSTGIPDLSSDD